MSKKGFAVMGIVLLLAGLLAGCGATPEPTAPPEPAALGEIALKINGMVSHKVGWSEEEVRAMETMEAESTNKDGETKTYTGVSLNKLLETAGPATDATAVVFVADDGSTAKVTLAEVKKCADCIVSFRNQGGFSIVLPGFPGNVQVKGVVEIQVQ
jgi:hypothetical protein